MNAIQEHITNEFCTCPKLCKELLELGLTKATAFRWRVNSIHNSSEIQTFLYDLDGACELASENVDAVYKVIYLLAFTISDLDNILPPYCITKMGTRQDRTTNTPCTIQAWDYQGGLVAVHSFTTTSVTRYQVYCIPFSPWQVFPGVNENAFGYIEADLQPLGGYRAVLQVDQRKFYQTHQLLYRNSQGVWIPLPCGARQTTKPTIPGRVPSKRLTPTGFWTAY